MSSLINHAGARESKFQNKIFNVASAVSQGKSLIYGLNSTLQSAQTALGLGSFSPASASSQPTQSGLLSSVTPSVPLLQAGASAIHSWVNSTAGSVPSATIPALGPRAAENSGSAQTSSVQSNSAQTDTPNSPYLPGTSRASPWANNATDGYGSDTKPAKFVRRSRTVELGTATEVGARIGYPFSSTVSGQTGYATQTLKVSKFILVRSKNAQR